MIDNSLPSSKKHLSAAVLVLIAAALFGASAPLSKLLLGSFDAITLAAFLYLGSGLGAGVLFMLKRGRRTIGTTRGSQDHTTDVPWLVGAVAAGGVIAPILMMLGLSQTPASTASLLLNFEGVATALLAAFLFKEAVGMRIILAMGLITLAAILFSWTGGAWGVSLGALAILAACLFWGLDNNLTRHISAKDPLVIVGIKGLGAGSFSFVLALALGRPLPAWGPALMALGVGAVCYGLSIQLFILGLRSLGAARTSTLYGVAPFLGALLSFVLLRESPTLLFWVGLPLMLAVRR